MSQKQTDPGKALLETGEIISRYRGRFILLAFVTVTIVLCVSLWIPRKYHAEATLERSVDLVLSEITSRGGGARPVQTPRGSLNKEIAGDPAVYELLRELEPKLRRHGYIQSDHDLQNLRRHLVRHVVIHWDVSTANIDRVRVSYVGSDPKLSAMLVNGLVEGYIQRTRTAMEQRLTQSVVFFQKKVAHSQDHIGELQASLLAFEIEHSRLLPDVSANTQIRIAELEAAIVDVTARREAAIIRAQSLRNALEQTPAHRPLEVRAANPELRELRDQIRNLREREREAVTTLKMTDRHPDLIDLRARLLALEVQLANTPAEIVTERQMRDNPRHAELELQLTQAVSEQDMLARQAAAMREQLGTMKASPAEIFTTRSKYQALNRQVDEAQRQLNFWEDNLRRVEVALAAEHGGHAVQFSFTPAGTARRPVSPNLTHVVTAAILLGFMAGGLGVFIAYRTDETFCDVQELASACNLPLIGAVSELVTNRHRRMRRVQHLFVYPVNGLAMLAVVAGLATLLYMDLERPGTFDKIRSTAAAALFGPAPATAAEPSVEISQPIDNPIHADGAQAEE